MQSKGPKQKRGGFEVTGGFGVVAAFFEGKGQIRRGGDPRMGSGLLLSSRRDALAAAAAAAAVDCLFVLLP